MTRLYGDPKVRLEYWVLQDQLASPLVLALLFWLLSLRQASSFSWRVLSRRSRPAQLWLLTLSCAHRQINDD